jgi:L-threonine kinase
MGYAVKIYSRIGELLQGVLPDGGDFLVSGLPSGLFFSEAEIVGPSSGDIVSPSPSETALPPKAQRALALFCQQYIPAGAQLPGIRLHSSTPPGKGLSSSSTDILSVLSVINEHWAAGCSPEDLYRIAAAVEPTDPCLSDEILLFRQGIGIAERCVTLPPMTILYFDADPDRQIETLDITRPRTPGAGRYFDWLLRKFLQAAESGDYAMLFDSITDSAEYNQTVLSLHRFDDYVRIARSAGVGLMVAHSGTIAGLLTRPEEAAELEGRLRTATDQPIYSEQYIPYP